jgi:hypothetical protein
MLSCGPQKEPSRSSLSYLALADSSRACRSRGLLVISPTCVLSGTFSRYSMAFPGGWRPFRSREWFSVPERGLNLWGSPLLVDGSSRHRLALLKRCKLCPKSGISLMPIDGLDTMLSSSPPKKHFYRLSASSNHFSVQPFFYYSGVIRVT